MISQQYWSRLLIRLTALALLMTGAAAHAQSFDASELLPTAVFAQAGLAEKNTQSYVLGLRWDWSWRKQLSFGEVTGFHEVSFGRWITDDGMGTTWATQLGITPVLRLHPAMASAWFGEIGIGANVIVPLFRNEEKRFSTEFNFGDHIAVGRQFGARGQQEISVRFQHFSNAGIDHPNPGENFSQLRYSYRF